MLSIQEINLLKSQNEGLKKQNKALQQELLRLKGRNTRPKTNFDCIRQMTVDEFVEFFAPLLFKVCAPDCIIQRTCAQTKAIDTPCKNIFKKWLESEEQCKKK